MANPDLLETILLNDAQAHLIRLRFHDTKEWDELAKCFPKFAEALDLLPDMSGFRYCNVMLRNMVVDTIKLFGFTKGANNG